MVMCLQMPNYDYECKGFHILQNWRNYKPKMFIFQWSILFVYKLLEVRYHSSRQMFFNSIVSYVRT